MSSFSHRTVTEPIAVAGLQIRTSNASELSGLGEIGPLWQRFFAEGTAAQIPHRTGDSLYVVYSNYASEENGEYDYLLGVPVSSVNSLPAGITYEAISTGRYAVLKTEKGSVISVVQDAWREIWAASAEELGGERAFLSDYEIYDDRAKDPEDALVEIHLGILPE